jgi:Fe-S cluster biosynthesis and repair protein YggX
MGLIVDDIVFLPGTIGKIIFNTLVQTIHKVAWTEYGSNLKRLLLRARHDYDINKITKEQFQEIEKDVFKEMRTVRRVMSSE